VIAPVSLQTVCVRHVPKGTEAKEVDAHNLDWVERLNASGEAFLTPAVVKGRQIVRVSVGAEATERADVAACWEAMKRYARS